MEETSQIVRHLLISTNEYGKARYRLILLKLIDRISDDVSSFVANLILLITVACFLLFANFGIAIYLGDILGNAFYGFFAVAGFYLIFSIMIHLFFKNWIKRCFHDAIICKMN